MDIEQLRGRELPSIQGAQHFCRWSEGIDHGGTQLLMHTHRR
jgi:hypothetical protein